ncbi:hypothetical protein DXH95_05235 [Sphingorhabdus pulchriflava]|uniref:Uncharacterized protein n=1 Tax=Sphingorhabdus pulchriflava TaxID=2292257 RepID=A0A371BGU1_9SPHN|nr:hypothetical protein [Sphingorhabdus pulchriflava]RDV06806.1 hypothetical protein DXH95_05235 [Sphingorhabdus pulchriflava]
MPDPERETVKALDRERKIQRAALTTDLEQARHDLHPQTLLQRWSARQRDRLLSATGTAKQKVANNAPAIGLAGIGILLFSLRKPISGWMNKFRDSRPETDKDDAQ